MRIEFSKHAPDLIRGLTAWARGSGSGPEQRGALGEQDAEFLKRIRSAFFSRKRARRGSLNLEAAMVVPIIVVMILLGRFILEASVNRQETAVFARGSTVAAAAARSTFLSCDFERDQFADHPEVIQGERVWCRRQNAEAGLSQERPMWDEVEDGASAWNDILRDVKPRRSPNDILATAQVDLSFERPAFLAQQNTVRAGQSYIAPERTIWNHDERQFRHGHDRVIWEEICGGRGATYALFPNVFPNGGGPRC